MLFPIYSFSKLFQAFKIYEDKRRVKLEQLKKEEEENEIMRLAVLKKEKLKSKVTAFFSHVFIKCTSVLQYDAQKEKRKEKNRLLKEQRTQEREERRERRERERMMKNSLGSNEPKLSKCERRQWKVEYLLRKQERGDRRKAKLKKQREDNLRKVGFWLFTAYLKGGSLLLYLKKS